MASLDSSGSGSQEAAVKLWWEGLQSSRPVTAVGASAPPTVDLSVGLLECPHTVVAGFPERRPHAGEQGGASDSSGKPRTPPFRRALLLSQATVCQREGTASGCKYPEAGSSGDPRKGCQPHLSSPVRAPLSASCCFAGTDRDAVQETACRGRREGGKCLSGKAAHP